MIVVQQKDAKKVKQFWIDLLLDVAGALMFSIGFYTFAENGDFAPGGVTGIALLIREFFPMLPLGLLSFAINVPIILACWPILGKKYMFRSLRTLLLVTFIMDGILSRFPVYTGDPLLASLFTGVFAGIGLGLIYMRGSNTGGSDFVVAAVKKKHPHLSFGQVTMAMDAVIIFLGWPVFGKVDAVLYGLISCIAYSLVMDQMMYGVGSGKLVIAITDDGQRCANAISDAVGRGATIVPATGSYTGAAREMVYCACSNSEVFRVRHAVNEVSPDSMLMVCEASDLYGKGFSENDKVL